MVREMPQELPVDCLGLAQPTGEMMRHRVAERPRELRRRRSGARHASNTSGRRRRRRGNCLGVFSFPSRQARVQTPQDGAVDGDQGVDVALAGRNERSEENTYELQSLMRISYAGFCLTKNTNLRSNDIYNIRRKTNTQGLAY